MKKNIFLHNNDLNVELIGSLRYSDIISLKKKIDYLSSIYDIEKVLIDLKKVSNKIYYLDELKGENTIFIN